MPPPDTVICVYAECINTAVVVERVWRWSRSRAGSHNLGARGHRVSIFGTRQIWSIRSVIFATERKLRESFIFGTVTAVLDWRRNVNTDVSVGNYWRVNGRSHGALYRQLWYGHGLRVHRARIHQGPVGGIQRNNSETEWRVLSKRSISVVRNKYGFVSVERNGRALIFIELETADGTKNR